MYRVAENMDHKEVTNSIHFPYYEFKNFSRRSRSVTFASNSSSSPLFIFLCWITFTNFLLKIYYSIKITLTLLDPIGIIYFFDAMADLSIF